VIRQAVYVIPLLMVDYVMGLVVKVIVMIVMMDMLVYFVHQNVRD
jgi:hypothetical protein